jgi:hypothetical protein
LTLSGASLPALKAGPFDRAHGPESIEGLGAAEWVKNKMKRLEMKLGEES